MKLHQQLASRTKLWLVAATALFVVLLGPVPARADDAVMAWNQIALAATVKAGQGPVPQIRTMAIVHVSMHDAVNAITCDYRTYLTIRCRGARPKRRRSLRPTAPSPTSSLRRCKR